MSKYLIGIDVGGTNTDAVLLDPASSDNDRAVISWNKQLTSNDVSGGIKDSILELFKSNVGVSKKDILSVTIGTTHFINSIVERDQARLDKVAVIRICGPFSHNVPPFSDFPSDLKNLLNGYNGLIAGGYHVDGSEILEIDEEEIRSHARKIKQLGLTAIAVTGVFSPAFQDQERKVLEILQDEIPLANIVLSHDLSGIGLLERENLAILNAAVKNFANKIIKAFSHAVRTSGIDAPILLTQNDGTVLTINEALKIPIKTFSSGTTNSMRGASFLLNKFKGENVIVLDVGGTTLDGGMLLSNGYPRKTSSYSFIGGVKTRLSMPQVESIGLGGGSIVRVLENEKVTIGPDSVGNDFSKSIVGGGSTLTTSDIAVSIEQSLENSDNDPILLIGDKSRVTNKVSNDLKNAYNVEILRMVEKLIDKIKTSPADIPVLLVGGGSFILPQSINGASEVWRPKYYQVANAIGAAIGKISAVSQKFGKVEDKEKIVEELTQQAREKALNNGALENTIQVVDIVSEELPYANLHRFETKVVADVDYTKLKLTVPDELQNATEIYDESSEQFEKKPLKNEGDEFVMGDVATYKPKIVDDEWIISETDLEFLRIGTYILGCGGGGDPYPQYLIARNLLRKGQVMKVVDVDFKQNYESISVGFCGSPTVSTERLQGSEIKTAYSLLNFKGDIESVVSLEIGGGNGFQGLLLGAELNAKVIDADLMGRAYPMIWQIFPVALSDEPFYSPCAFSDGNGNDVMVSKTKTNQHAEKIVRSALSELGSFVGLVSSIKNVNSLVIRNSISLAWRIGRAVTLAKQKSDIENLPEHIIKSVSPTGAKKLFTGKIIGIEKKVHKGYVFGEVIIEDGNHTLRIPFQNENIYAELDGEVVASVPDLITVIDADTGEAVGTPDYKYGLLVVVLTIAPSNLWTDTEKALKLGGPEAFGLDNIKYKTTTEPYVKPHSVIEEYK
ncbi:hypothetical protein BN7_1464 [Wickerhamomyces ciferrii]|uniref:Uncharacterized protein n=1 Tax=Wickerhamomyces ciferrii (strain ATCC 14091 / BCRC 22168 / CBS 111 / JCM 3599 / NBRC 0793 / NRRL Y-1031 F-60-10) TaxID=1206466 RepID=K0KAE0_WICCF|nr:uncharacterized protein BN7_1464 [Wickerhamomyces ciferrii]CCH41925.1 hypothetical protein BN7_1464 [Wickerhamomyces ciferrii]